MTRQQSEGEVHVAAMRLILAAMERREDPPDWTIWQHMLSMLETIFQGIEDQRGDDQDELFHTRRNLDAKQAEMVAAVEYLRQDRDHWMQARRDAIEAGELMQAEIETLRQQLDAAKVYDGNTVAQKACEYSAELGALWAQMARANIAFPQEKSLVQSVQILRESHDAAVAEIETLRQRLANAQREASDEFIERQVLQHEASDDYVELVRLRVFVGKAREMTQNSYYSVDAYRLRAALAELDAGPSEPTPVAEPLDADGGA